MTWGSVSQVLGVFKSRFSGGICWDLLVGCATPASILGTSSRNLFNIFSGMFLAKKDICWVLLEQAWAIDQSLVIPMRTPKEVQAAVCRLHFFFPFADVQIVKPPMPIFDLSIRPLIRPPLPHSTAILPRSIRLWQRTRREAWRASLPIWVATATPNCCVCGSNSDIRKMFKGDLSYSAFC